MSYVPLPIFNFISLLHLHLLIYSIYFSIHKYIDLLSTVHRPYNHPTSTLLSTFFNTASWIVKLYTTTTTTFLLFSLHHHHHHHHISIVFPPPPPPPPPHFYCFLPHFFLIVFPPPPPPSPPPHFYCFPRKGQRSKSGLNIWVSPFRCDFGPFDLFEGKQ